MKSTLIRLAMILAVGAGHHAFGQAKLITIQLRSGVDGKAVRGAKLRVYFPDEPETASLTLVTDSKGEVRLSPGNATEVSVAPVGYASCGDGHFGLPTAYSVQTILHQGILAMNACLGPKGTRETLETGKLTYFVRQRTTMEW